MSTHEYQDLLTTVPLESGTTQSLASFGRSIAFVTRRGFLATLTTAAAGAVIGLQHAEAQPGSRPPITDILNFALNLEYLEANFYLYGTTGHGLSGNETGMGPTPTGAPTGIALEPETLAVIQPLAQDATNHVILLRAAITSLGGTPIAQPAINFAAFGRITTQALFLAATQHFVALGNSAYTGSAQFLAANPSVLTTVAQILAAKGQHAGMVNALCIAQRVSARALDVQDVSPEKTSCFTVAPGTGLAPARTASEILGVAYGVSTADTTTPFPGTTLGGFFPHGANGNIRTT